MNSQCKLTNGSSQLISINQSINTPIVCAQVKFVNPLLMPCLHGWRRLICHQSTLPNLQQRKTKRWVKYEAPCGRQLRNTGEVDKYLRVVNSWLTIDQFSFDCNVLTNREYESNACFMKIEDITGGKEVVPISAVNCIDNQMPGRYLARPVIFVLSVRRFTLKKNKPWERQPLFKELQIY